MLIFNFSRTNNKEMRLEKDDAREEVRPVKDDKQRSKERKEDKHAKEDRVYRVRL